MSVIDIFSEFHYNHGSGFELARSLCRARGSCASGMPFYGKLRKYIVLGENNIHN